MDQSNCDDLEQVSSNTPNGIEMRVDTIRDTKDQKERQNVEIAILEHENVQHQNGQQSSSSSACFIDASSLLDENEIIGDIMDLPHPVVPNPSSVDIPFTESFPRKLSERSASSSSSGSLNNLSDEEKLLKREIKKTFGDIKDQYNCDGVELRRKTFPAPVAGTPSLNDRRLAELERKQGELIFKNNIQHFSSHLMNNNSNISTITNNLNSNPSIDIYDTQQPRKFSNSSEKSYFLPDTPHNSIAHVDNSSSNSLNSPKLFRKSKCDESSPIISGGINTKFESSSSSIDEIQRDFSSASSSKNSKSHNQSWVVDMSHSGPASARPRSSSTSGNESISSIERKSNPSMGFYVSLHDMDSSPKSLDSTITFNNFKKEKKSTEFYIDFSDTSREGTPKMARKKPAFLQRRSEEKEPEDKKLKEAEDVTLRKSLSSSVEKDSSKRHTWGSDSGDMKILDKISLISKVSNSSNSIDDSTYTKSVNLYGGTTYDKHSSQDSLTDALLSSSTKKSTSSTEETEELTYQEENDDKSPAKPAAAQHFGRFPGIMETIMESKESSSPSKTNQFKHHTMETLQATMEKQLQLLENGSSENGCFVKLSDMDKPSPKFELHSPEMSKSTGNRQINRIFFDSRSSNRPHSWAMTRSTGNNIMNITSSMDNLKSITRLFPHLSKELSNSLPNYIPFQNSPTPPYCVGQSDLSMDSSSLTSSFSRSAMDESSMSCRQPRRLGEDLLKMFIQELATDVAIEVNGRLIKAHKCILRSRCQYFAAMLAGDWNDGNNSLALPGFSYSSVHFALCHIYSGASHPPEGISLMELAALADLLGLEGLKEVTSHALKVNYCHNFHKPCSGCIDGILQVLPVALNHALDDLYRKCLKWTCKYYMKVWPTRHFAQLPEDIFKRCRQQIVAYMSSESVLETILDCDSLLSHLATYRWAVAVETLTRDILESAYNYISDHFANVIASDYFLSLGHDKYKYIMHLENIILHTAATLCPDQACRSYQRITRLNAVLAAKVITFPSNPEELLNCVANGEMKNLHLKFEDIEKVQQDWHEDFIRLVSAILSAVEQCLIRQCSRAMRGMSWQRMDIDLRKKIQTLARLNDPLEFRRTSAASSTGSGGGGKPVAKAFSFGGSSSRTQNLIQVKLAMQASKKTIHTQTNDFQENQNRVTNYNSNYNNVGHGTTGKESASTRNLSTTKPKPKLSTTKRSQQSEDVIKPPVKPRSKLSNVPPRYLEPKKLPPQPPEKKKSVVEKSNTMSLDSLASPRKKLDRTKTEPEKDICTDSLGVSTKSSFISDHLTSQESLTRGGVQRTTLAAQAKTVANRKISNNSSSSSVTNRSSKFSSLNSMNSPAAAFQKRSISVPGTTSDKSSPSSVASESKKKSFLSAKSREILAKRDERNKQQQQKQQQQHVTVEVTRPTNNRNYNIGKSSSVSNIPTRKNTNVLRNLNLRNSQIAAVTSAKSRTSSPRTPSTKIPSQVKLAAPEPITPEKPDSSSENPDIMSISKLERSSTFCMETSDLPVSELQIIE